MRDTTDVERGLLKHLVISPILLRMNINHVEDEWFSTSERIFIIRMIRRHFRQYKSVLSETVFDSLISRVRKNQKLIQAEWNMIKNLSFYDDIGTTIAVLKEQKSIEEITDLFSEAMDKIEEGEVQDAINILRKKSIFIGKTHVDNPIVALSDTQERKQLMLDKKSNPEKYMGLKTGYKTFDYRTGGLFPAELTLTVGVTGSGKSTFLKSVSFGVSSYNKNILYVTNEENKLQVLMKFDALVSNRPYSDFKWAKISDEDIEKWENHLRDGLKKAGFGQIYVKEIPAFANVLDIERAFLELKQNNVDIDLIVIDYLDHLLPIQKAWSETDEQGKAAADCKILAVELNVPVFTATQAATHVEEKQEKGRSYAKMDVYGSKRKVHESNTVLGINVLGEIRDHKRKAGERDRLWEVQVIKNRDGGEFNYKSKHEVLNGRVVEIDADKNPVDNKYDIADQAFADELWNELDEDSGKNNESQAIEEVDEDFGGDNE